MQRSYSASSANYQSMYRLQPKTYFYSSDSDSYHQMNLQRNSSSSSFCSSTSSSSANYRILPVRYSSTERTLHKPPTITSNQHGINVRIEFERPSKSSQYHRRNRREHKDEYEHHRKRHMSKHQQQYGSCPILNQTTTIPRQSNIKYIETRSIIRGYSYEHLNKPSHSSTLIIRHQSLPKSSSTSRIGQTRIKHIPLDLQSMYKPITARVIREEEECIEKICFFFLVSTIEKSKWICFVIFEIFILFFRTSKMIFFHKQVEFKIYEISFDKN